MDAVQIITISEAQSDYDASIAAYFLPPSEDLSENEYLTLILGTPDFGMSYLGILHNDSEDIYNIISFNSSMGENPLGFDIVATVDSSWTDTGYTFGLKIDTQISGDDATFSGYYYYGNSAPEPDSTTGWTSLTLPHDTVEGWVTAHSGNDYTAAVGGIFSMTGIGINPGPLGGGVPEPSTVVLLILGLSGIWFKIKRKK